MKHLLIAAATLLFPAIASASSLEVNAQCGLTVTSDNPISRLIYRTAEKQNVWIESTTGTVYDIPGEVIVNPQARDQIVVVATDGSKERLFFGSALANELSNCGVDPEPDGCPIDVDAWSGLALSKYREVWSTNPAHQTGAFQQDEDWDDGFLMAPDGLSCEHYANETDFLTSRVMFLTTFEIGVTSTEVYAQLKQRITAAGNPYPGDFPGFPDALWYVTDESQRESLNANEYAACAADVQEYCSSW